ncbi:[acyl-carrier-protein] S-malonyltransferase [Salsuginibacillus halophilus]|uniref:Malonyl CoA-acyl carrier protein transacylase n=1 Tax=Salsuginibacillus halophilus TaxID=517424 RepID=A0A2P8HY35_9BACI|nr:ACP S-malonyltransferase [Salsuginibacillus halophilus]PSL51156.1 [acyl-carrier-protein] S-malonyltransferase [Salsuginibacillus halophilus]
MGKLAFLFPGQGSQAVGMAQELMQNRQEAADIGKAADEAVGYNLTHLMAEGPEDTLTKTENAQPALVTASCAFLPAIEAAGIRPDFTAGHSLGEYAALVAAGVLSFAEAVEAVHARGRLMEEAVPAGEGTMAAVMGMAREDLETVLEAVQAEGEAVEAANMNAPGQIVISGSASGVARAGEKLKEEGAKRVVPLNVSGPFHSSLMQPAADGLTEVLDGLSFTDAQIPVVQNVNAKPTTDAQALKDGLVSQVTSPVLWEDTVRTLLDEGVDTFVEIGSKNVLSSLVRKIQRKDITVLAVEDEASLEQLLNLERGDG